MAIQTQSSALPPEAGAAYAFGPFVLDVENGVLYRTGLPVEMPAKVFEILRCLVLRGDRLVSKQLLVEEVWGNSPIGDNNIAQHVHLVREVLDDLVKPYRYIVTVHGRGYRLLVEPRRVTPPPKPVLPGAMLPQSLAAELVSNAVFFAKIGTAAALESSARLCRTALELHPAYADAHAQIALVAMLKAAFLCGSPMQQYDVAHRHVTEALRLDTQCARAHAAGAALALFADLDLARAHRHLDAAAGVWGDLPEAAILRILAFSAGGSADAALQASREALALHPGSAVLTAYAAFAAYLAEDLESAAGSLERLLVFKPGAPFATYLLGLTRLAHGSYAAAAETFHSLVAGRISLVAGYEKFRQRAIAALSFIEARTGAAEDAEALAKDVQRSEPCSYVALAIARAGAQDEDGVVWCLREARVRRDPWFPFVARDPVFAEYRALPDFKEVATLPQIVNEL